MLHSYGVLGLAPCHFTCRNTCRYRWLIRPPFPHLGTASLAQVSKTGLCPLHCFTIRNSLLSEGYTHTNTHTQTLTHKHSHTHTNTHTHKHTHTQTNTHTHTRTRTHARCTRLHTSPHSLFVALRGWALDLCVRLLANTFFSALQVYQQHRK